MRTCKALLQRNWQEWKEIYGLESRVFYHQSITYFDCIECIDINDIKCLLIEQVHQTKTTANDERSGPPLSKPLQGQSSEAALRERRIVRELGVTAVDM